MHYRPPSHYKCRLCSYCWLKRKTFSIPTISFHKGLKPYIHLRIIVFIGTPLTIWLPLLLTQLSVCVLYNLQILILTIVVYIYFQFSYDIVNINGLHTSESFNEITLKAFFSPFCSCSIFMRPVNCTFEHKKLLTSLRGDEWLNTKAHPFIKGGCSCIHN